MFTYCGFDSNNIIHFDFNNQKIYNPFEIALQAMIGEMVSDSYRIPGGNLIPRYYPLRFLPDPRDDEYKKKAMNWILMNGTTCSDALIWNYTFNWEYRNMKKKSPWVCAFGQSYIVLALLLWFDYSREQKYLDLAKKAAKGITNSINKGGCSFKISKNAVFFEEIPDSSPSHIFNAHLLSLIALIELFQRSNDFFVLNQIRKGLEGFKKFAPHFFTGYGSAYDYETMNDKTVLGFQVIPDNDKNIAIISCEGRNTNYHRKITVGADDSFLMSDCFISGIDWDQVSHFGILSGRYLRLNEQRKIGNNRGDEDQHTYFYFQNVPLKEDNFFLDIEVHAQKEGHLFVNWRPSDDSAWSPTEKNMLSIPKGHSHLQIYVKGICSGANVSIIYHQFHIFLFDELCGMLKDINIGNKVALLEKPSIIQNQFFSTAGEKKKFIMGIFMNIFHSNNPVKYISFLDKYSQLLVNSSDIKNGEYVCDKKVHLSTLYLSINTKCGLKCKMCDIGIKNTESSLYKNLISHNDQVLLDPDIIMKRCREAKNEINTVHFIGTEPLFHPEIISIISGLKKEGFKVILTTNGLLLDKYIIELLTAGLDELWISIDGPESIHDDIRGLKGLFTKIMRVIDENSQKIILCQGEGFKLFFSCAISPWNYKYLDEILTTTYTLPISGYSFTHLNFLSSDCAREHSIQYPEYPIGSSIPHVEIDHINPFELFSSIYKIKELAVKFSKNAFFSPELDYIGIVDHYYHPERPTGRPTCNVPHSCLQVNPDGSLCVMSRCYQFPIGNIYHDSLLDAFYGDSMNKFRSFIDSNPLPKPCFRCCGIM